MDAEPKRYPDGFADALAQRLLGEMDVRFAGMNTRFAAMDARYDAMDEKLLAISEQLNTLDQRLTRLELRVAQLEAGFNALRQDVAGLHQVRGPERLCARVESMSGLDKRSSDRLETPPTNPRASHSAIPRDATLQILHSKEDRVTYGSDSWGQEAAALRSDVEHLRRVLSDGLERATNTLDRLQQAAERAGRDEHDLRYRIGSVEEQILTVNRRVDSVENRHRRLESRFELAHFRAGVPAPPAPSPEQDQAR